VTVLTGGRVVTSLSPPHLIAADVLVAADRVVSVGPVPQGGERLDCGGCLVIPGNVCAHHHLYSALARGMPYRLDPPRDFVEILRRVWWRLDRALDPGSIRASALVGGSDALLAGTTTVVDHHASPEAIEESLSGIASGLRQVGMRSILCYEVTDRDGPDRAAAGLEETRRFLKQDTDSFLRGMVGAHASFTLSEETMTGCVEVARESGTGIHIHVAEDAADQADAESRFGSRVIHRLHDAGALDEMTLLAHCIHLDRSELEVLRESGSTAVHNPRSNMNNRVGHAPVASFTRLALGTDGIGGDMFAEARAAYWRARESDANVGPQWVLDRLAESARFAGAVFDEPLLGRIEPGAPADVVVLDYDPPSPLTDDNLAGHWVFGLSARRVRDVLVGGEVVVRDGRLARLDGGEIAATGREEAERLWRRMDEIDEHPFVPAGGQVS
jgi:putative selenium metabolism protein SsnA